MLPPPQTADPAYARTNCKGYAKTLMYRKYGTKRVSDVSI